MFRTRHAVSNFPQQKGKTNVFLKLLEAGLKMFNDG
jgi:hypothetical protein